MVFVPVSDDNPLRSIKFQWVTVGLIAINIVVFVFTVAGVPEHVMLSFALVPRELLDEGLLGTATYPHKFNTIDVRERWTLLTYMFMHGNALHLLGNMLFLWVFGDNVEDAMGHVRFLAFYLMCGVLAALFHAWMLPASELPLIGASGAISGIVAAYVLLHPRVMIWVLAFRIIPMRLPAMVVLGLWIAVQLVMPFVASASPIAWWAHIGGILAGAVLVLVMRRPGVALFQGFGGR